MASLNKRTRNEIARFGQESGDERESVAPAAPAPPPRKRPNAAAASSSSSSSSSSSAPLSTAASSFEHGSVAFEILEAVALARMTAPMPRKALAARGRWEDTLAQGLGPLCRIVDVAAAWRRATRTAMVTAVAYNVVAVGLALMGVLTPLSCAVLMPASSLVVVALVRAAFGRSLMVKSHERALKMSPRSA